MDLVAAQPLHGRAARGSEAAEDEATPSKSFLRRRTREGFAPGSRDSRRAPWASSPGRFALLQHAEGGARLGPERGPLVAAKLEGLVGPAVRKQAAPQRTARGRKASSRRASRPSSRTRLSRRSSRSCSESRVQRRAASDGAVAAQRSSGRGSRACGGSARQKRSTCSVALKRRLQLRQLARHLGRVRVPALRGVQLERGPGAHAEVSNDGVQLPRSRFFGSRRRWTASIQRPQASPGGHAQLSAAWPSAADIEAKTKKEPTCRSSKVRGSRSA